MKNYLKIAGNIHLSYFVEAADLLGIDYEIIIPSLTAKFSYEGKHWYINNTVTPLTNAPSSKLARKKNFTNIILAKFGLPVPYQQKLINEIEALKFFGRYKNIVIKPSQNIGGKGVSILPKTEDEVLESFKYARENDKFGVVLAEEYIEGDNYRVLVLGNEVISVIKRNPPQIIGDGLNTISKLIEVRNAQRKEQLLYPIHVDHELKRKLQDKGYTLDSVLAENEIVVLRDNANMTTGGTTVEVSKEIAQYYKDICVNAVKALDLEYAGVDLITPDITKEVKCAINEVNFNPGLRVHYKVDSGEPVKVAIPIMKYIKEKYCK